MSPQTLLAELASGHPVSGAELAARLGVTRAAVWKQVEGLRRRGLPVEARAGSGYCLPWPLQLLDPAAIGAGLHCSPDLLEVHWELDSTSSELQRRGECGDFAVMLAETQSAGRGRRGRSWLSPPALNVYLSCRWRFECGFAALAGLSLVAGLAVARALAALGVPGVGLKWPNDVLADGAKLAGILVELSGEAQGSCAAVIGIGLNVRVTDALREQAGQPVTDLATLCGGTAPDRNQVVAALLDALAGALQHFAMAGFAPFVDAYGELDLLHGQALWLHGVDGRVAAIGAGVDAGGALLARGDGGLLRIDSGDVSVRLS